VAQRVNLRWVAAPELSAAHATYVVATGAPCIDQRIEQLLLGSVTDINNRLVTASIDMAQFWKEYFNQVVAQTEMGEACTRALMTAGCSELQVEQTAKAITRRLGDARQAFQKKFPKLAEQLELRAKPLHDRWDTVGPGLLREVERQIWANSPPPGWWPPRVNLWMVQPIRGGDGGFDSDDTSLWMEAMLTDVDPRVPEVLRIVWLMTRLAIDQHTRNKSGESALSLPWSLVSVPIVLTAGAELELFGGRLPIRAAMELWRFGDAGTAKILEIWWDQHTREPAPLPVALKLLQRAIAEAQPDSVERSEDPAGGW
jgi:hypothetical protein